MRNKRNIPILLLTAWLLAITTSCSEETPTTDAERQQSVSLIVNEQPWEEEEINLTRSSAEMIEKLKDSKGFGLFCSGMNMVENQQVLWENGQWNYGQKVLWPVEKSAEKNFYAYAPYADGTEITATSIENITFTPSATDNQTDLLYAQTLNAKSTDAQGSVTLDFHHALGKISFGTFTNNYGRDITLKSISLKGELYTTRTFSLNELTWTSTTASESELSIDHTDINQTFTSGTTTSINTKAFLLIPGPTVTITLTFSTSDFLTETAHFQTTLERGINKTFNITISNNFEVVIDD